jgi:hypothetical protein
MAPPSRKRREPYRLLWLWRTDATRPPGLESSAKAFAVTPFIRRELLRRNSVIEDERAALGWPVRF